VDPLFRFQAEQECARLLKIYCNSMDAGHIERLLSVFANDAMWQPTNGPALNGHAEIAAFAKKNGIGSISAHCITNIVVDVNDSDHATANAYGLVFRGASSTTAGHFPPALPRSVVHYEDKFIRQEGRWLISQKLNRQIFKREEV